MSQLTLPANLSLPANLEHLLTQFLQAQLPKPIQLDPSVLAYRWQSNSRTGSGELVPLTVDLRLTLDDLLGIEVQKNKLIQNTRQYLAGLPAMTLPAGFSRTGLPIGVQLIGNYFAEAKILGVAHQMQLNSDWHNKVPV